ncbi:MAG: hypothetical protein DHS80DRAFT_22869 [Piptocephalis tieghemiana]|nr:MAG: hypothetical protein DHS80DRAFT_22869 [Piptocephalis tieghemiana]
MQSYLHQLSSGSSSRLPSSSTTTSPSPSPPSSSSFSRHRKPPPAPLGLKTARPYRRTHHRSMTAPQIYRSNPSAPARLGGTGTASPPMHPPSPSPSTPGLLLDKSTDFQGLESLMASLPSTNLFSSPPSQVPSLADLLVRYAHNEPLLLALLQAKAAEDQRIAAEQEQSRAWAQLQASRMDQASSIPMTPASPIDSMDDMIPPSLSPSHHPPSLPHHHHHHHLPHTHPYGFHHPQGPMISPAASTTSLSSTLSDSPADLSGYLWPPQPSSSSSSPEDLVGVIDPAIAAFLQEQDNPMEDLLPSDPSTDPSSDSSSEPSSSSFISSLNAMSLDPSHPHHPHHHHQQQQQHWPLSTSSSSQPSSSIDPSPDAPSSMAPHPSIPLNSSLPSPTSPPPPSSSSPSSSPSSVVAPTTSEEDEKKQEHQRIMRVVREMALSRQRSPTH